MADYQLTQTGDEVQDILDNSQTGKYFYNQSVATWSSDATYSDYPKKGLITLTGVKGTDGVEVTFSNADATSGNYSPICNSVANGVEIWAKAQDNGLVIPTIHITTGADVQLQGDDAYLPISGGNITGSLSVVGDPVVTLDLRLSYPTANTTYVTGNSNITRCYILNGMACITGAFVIAANTPNDSVLFTGLPAPRDGLNFACSLTSNNQTAHRAIIKTDGSLRTDGVALNTASWYSFFVCYPTAD